MRINHNIAALNTHNQLNQANNANSKSMEKLSSGLRINRAGDDAAGLAISEKMRGQIRGLEQAERNAQDGISMIQTAEGAMNESHSILQRMRELAVQSSNDTNTTEDRAELQKEVDQLSQELSRIGDNTEFNTQNLLDGSFSGKFQIGANEGQNLELAIGDMRGQALGMAGDAKVAVTSSVVDGSDTNTDIAQGTYTVQENKSGDFDMVDQNGSVVATSTDSGATFSASTGDDTIDFATAGKAKVTSGTVTVDGSGNVSATGSVQNQGLEAGNYTYDNASSSLMDSNGKVVATDTATAGTFVDASGGAVATFANPLANGDAVKVGGIDISSQASADKAVTQINDAIETVSSERSKLGANQNRLEHTINNLSTSSENLTAAESRIRDVDMAEEIMNQTKQSILAQASQSMLAKANQNPQNVLQLLR
ncbi:flagellin [Pontibacillus halophilus JSM 076056 = DSM 19796]|uniref:Flagellin n=1 Tax=Pontibacillus halophilus JSM 076056 = DSM 19796 TaxID=1385510 RepID=A0A0A5GS19_9BACI|nr:flagellin [Pontibacillus halophilus]KGX93955.1 flagellin [Pontibacillus halophilus JSM 076056 = DSM 19796]